jgi:uncharacterized alkaline shock family protein YloU
MQLGERQTEELIPTRETADSVVATVAGDAALKLLGMNSAGQSARKNLPECMAAKQRLSGRRWNR